MGAKIDDRVVGTQGVYSFRIQGEMYHRIGSLLPDDGATPAFSQVYIYEQHLMPNLDSSTLAQLQAMLHELNPYVHIFRQAAEILQENPLQDLKLVIMKTHNEYQYTTPTVSEVAVLMVGDGQEAEPSNRDIVIHKKSGELQRTRKFTILTVHCIITFRKKKNTS